MLPRTPKLLKLLAALTLCAPLIGAALPAQTHTPVHGPARVRPAVTPLTLPALFLSDIHFDPLRDPAKAHRLNAAPVSQWPAILGAPPTPTAAADYAAINKSCPIKPLV